MREEILRRASILVPTLRKRAALTEEMRRVPDDTVNDLLEAQLIRIGVPERYGGLPIDHELMFEVGFELGRGCGASAWCHSLWTVHSWLVGFWPLQAQEEVFSTGPDTLACSAFAPEGKTMTACPGGYRVSGQWQFSSGCDASSWAMLGANADEGLRWFLVPRADFEIVDTWFVSGLAGSGSKDIRVEEKLVPAHRVLDPATAGDGDWTGWELHRQARYRVPMRTLLGWDLVSPLVGIARGCLDEFVARIRAQSPRSARNTDSGAMQVRLATSAAEVDAARALFMADVREVLTKGAEGSDFSELDRARYVRDRAFVSMLCMQAVNRLFEASGAHALFQSEAIQRFHRDAHALSHRDLMMLDLAGQAYGRAALKQEPGPGDVK